MMTGIEDKLRDGFGRIPRSTNRIDSKDILERGRTTARRRQYLLLAMGTVLVASIGGSALAVWPRSPVDSGDTAAAVNHSLMVRAETDSLRKLSFEGVLVRVQLAEDDGGRVVFDSGLAAGSFDTPVTVASTQRLVASASAFPCNGSCSDADVEAYSCEGKPFTPANTDEVRVKFTSTECQFVVLPQ